MSRGRVMWQASWPTLMILGILVILCLIGNANWPTQWVLPRRDIPPERLEALRSHTIDAISIQDLILFTLAVVFLSIKNTIMWQRMRPGWDPVTVSLIAVNAVFAALYAFVVAAGLFPYWLEVHADARYWLTTLLRYSLIIVLVWGGWTLINVPPPEETNAAPRDRLPAGTATGDRGARGDAVPRNRQTGTR